MPLDYSQLFYDQLWKLQGLYPEHYRMSNLCYICKHDKIENGRLDDKFQYSIKPPKLNINKKDDGGNANTRDRYMGILLNEFLSSVEKTENYRILYNKIAHLWGKAKADKFLEDDIRGAIYAHNGQNIVTKPYCFAYDFDKLVDKGAFFTDIADRPAQHLDSFIQHVIELVAVTCRETTGAVGLPALFPYMWYYWNKDCTDNGWDMKHYNSQAYGYLEQQIQMLVYKLNGSEMRMNESAFTNVSCMDESYLEAFFGDRLFPDGVPIINHINEIVQLEFFFLKCVNDILEKKVMTFPVITDCILYDAEKEEFVNKFTARIFCGLNIKWCNANMYCGTDLSTLSTCCRVLNNFETLNKKLTGFSNFIGGSDLNIGSVGVVTLNLPNWARYCVENGYSKNSVVTELRERIRNCLEYLDGIRECFYDLIKKKALKIYDLELAKIERQFNTLGFIGLYDAGRILGIEDDEILSFEKQILEIFKEETDDFEKTYFDEYHAEYSINIEQIPGESACVKLAKKDKITFGDGVDCYSNQWIPLNKKCSINERSDYAAVLDKLCGGGSILHLNIDAPFANVNQQWELLNAMAKKGVIYFAINNRISVDEQEHGFYGETCWCGAPKCGEATRPVGFITLVKNWIPSRKEEYKEREWISL